MQFFDSVQLIDLLKFDTLIKELDQAFGSDQIEVPLRHHHNFNKQNTLLLMPSWESEGYGGVKIVTVCPENKMYNQPSINGIYYLFNASTGLPVCTLDASTLTSIRTAAASALASVYLSREDSSVLLMIGTGNLAPYLIEAHAQARPISKVLIYGRDIKKATTICSRLQGKKYECLPVESIEEGLKEANIISCATLSDHPLIKGEWLHPGQHIDLVGSFKPTMREADDQVIISSSLFVDTFEGAIKESGDIVIPLEKGIINRNDIKGDLFKLCSKQVKGRTSNSEITCFKSVGHALEDLVAAKLAYQQSGHSL